MLIFCILIVAFGYSQVLCMEFFSKTLERRYSFRYTILGAGFCWVIGSLLKIPVFFNVGMEYLPLQNAVIFMMQCCYQLFFFKGTFQKRVLAMILLYVYMFFVEMVALKIAGVLCAQEQLTQIESTYTIVAQIVMFPIVFLFFYPFLSIWKLVLRIDSGNRGKMWLSIFLPFSQYLFMENLVEAYAIKQRNISPLFILGIFLGILADFYMFILFHRENLNEQAKQELYLEQELYQKEHIYYEYLQESQKEVSRIRHDFQNYVLVFRNILQQMQ